MRNYNSPPPAVHETEATIPLNATWQPSPSNPERGEINVFVTGAPGHEKLENLILGHISRGNNDQNLLLAYVDTIYLDDNYRRKGWAKNVSSLR